MKHFIKTITLFALLSLSFNTSANEEYTIMYYNILGFDVGDSRLSGFREIISAISPDLLIVNELKTETDASYILDSVLNLYGIDVYQKAVFTDGWDTDNMLFFNSSRFRLLKQDTIQTPYRLINRYTLIPLTPEYIVNNGDTLFINLMGLHLKAGSSNSDRLKRKEEAEKLRAYLDNEVGLENILLGGDFNFYDSKEEALSYILEKGNIKLIDPLDMIGDWSDNNSYSNIHTQSTRVRSFGGGSTGGLDDRFDFIFISPDVLTGTNGLKYTSGSYQAYGNDGIHFNDSINAPPFNPSIEPRVINALHYMSDHLPVILKFSIGDFSGIDNPIAIENNYILYPNPANNKIFIENKKVSSNFNLGFSFYSAMGNLLYSGHIENKAIDISTFEEGLYFLQIITPTQTFTRKVLISR